MAAGGPSRGAAASLVPGRMAGEVHERGRWLSPRLALMDRGQVLLILGKKTLQFFPSFPSIPDYCCKYPETFRHGVSLPRKVWGLAVGSGSRRRAASPWSDEHSVFPGEQ